ncbi:bifunctional acetate--CoA ligase family protein/GNAT family N-acetyltransferase [Desulfonema magnum]|uniref:CoA ligase domain-containing protein n=1 Tax=Desulfonema magnum TaxID=45655 RepID=A0A975GP25_9BACT|nr:bifunctional acetate--CoA ligase family protein/GNAT family N-acetyltransferase [Desulfonema magnum]QTA88571.1 CoA ligase domain-containing protein [Desulfonema magnum]
MGVHNLDKMFQPKSVAVIGASEKQGTIGSALMRNLIQGGYTGEIYPVNPKRKTIWNLEAYPSIPDINAQPDLAIIATPITTASRIVRECSEAGVGGAVIISAGGKEMGEKGREIEAEIKKEAEHSGLRIIGPNCLGIVSTQSKLNASFAGRMPLPGKMALVAQSGAICTSILDLSLKEKMGFSYFVSIGSMLDADFGDMIDYLGSDYKVSSIVMYIESLTHFRKFMSAARAVSRIKPIIAYKAGRSQAGARAAASHTGALAGEDAIYDAAFKRAGIIRVKTFEELFDCAELLAKQPRPLGSGLAIVTNAGGPGVMAVDALDYYGVEPVALSSETLGKLNEILPPHWSHGNPIDILGDAPPERFRKVVEICLKAREINGLLIMTAPQALTDPTDIAKSVADLLQGKPYPVFTSWMGGADMEKGREIFNEAGIPTFDTAERAVRAFMDLHRYGKKIEMLQEIPPRLPGKLEFEQEKAKAIIQKGLKRENPLLTETEAKDLLTAYGIPVNPTHVAVSEDEAVRKATDMGFPVAMKIYSRDITHKSDAGGVKLNLTSENDVRNAFTRIMADAKAYDPKADIEGVTIQPMLRRPDYELILGTKKDRDFGPVILFGMGGIMTEVLKDRSLALPPLNRLLARQIMEQTKVYRILQGYRNHPPANLMLLEEILIRLSQLVTDFPEIEELDMNPVLVVGNDVRAVDARVLLKPSDVPSPLHLVISSYPNHHEIRAETKHGDKIFIRPVRPEDAPLFTKLFYSLSPQSVYFRFFSPIKHLRHEVLARFTQIDYDREIGLVAIHESSTEGENGGEEMLGVARVITEAGGKKAEFSVLISDSWQGKGIGAALLERCLEIAKEHGDIQKVWGIVLPENRNMLALGRKLGFTIQKDPDSNDYLLSLEFQKA